MANESSKIRFYDLASPEIDDNFAPSGVQTAAPAPRAVDPEPMSNAVAYGERLVGKPDDLETLDVRKNSRFRLHDHPSE